jgi:hypothetical protein
MIQLSEAANASYFVSDFFFNVDILSPRYTGQVPCKPIAIGTKPSRPPSFGRLYQEK